MSSIRRGAVAAAVAVAVLSTLGACGDKTDAKNFTPASNVEYQPVNGISLNSTYIQVRNLYLLTPQGNTPARLSMTMVNQSNTLDALIGAQVGFRAIGGELRGGTLGAVPVVPLTSVIVGADSGPDILFPNYVPTAGVFVPVRLLFRSGRAVTGQILVQDALSEHSDGTVPFGTAAALPTVAATSNPLPDVPGITATPGAGAQPAPTVTVTLDPNTGETVGPSPTATP